MISATILSILLGAAIGSFLNVCIDRLPSGGSLLGPPSHCPSCSRRLAILDLIPIVSFVALRGRCRYCGIAIPPRLLFVELFTAIAFGAIFWYLGPGLKLLTVLVYLCVLEIITVVDLRENIIPNVVVYPAMVIALVFAPFAGPGLLMAFLGGLAGFVILLIPALVYRKGMGLGDVKLTGFIGLAVGLKLVFVAIFIAIVVGALFGLALIALKRKQMKEGIPFGPFLSFGTMIAMLWGNWLMDWYFSLAQR
jgi:leader peptidase (prepilin peptidase)/N-methyltransferase